MEETELEDKDYKRMWGRLSDEMRGLRTKGVASINREVVEGYMGFIKQAVGYERKIDDLETYLIKAGGS